MTADYPGRHASRARTHCRVPACYVPVFESHVIPARVVAGPAIICVSREVGAYTAGAAIAARFRLGVAAGAGSSVTDALAVHALLAFGTFNITVAAIKRIVHYIRASAATVLIGRVWADALSILAFPR